MPVQPAMAKALIWPNKQMGGTAGEMAEMIGSEAVVPLTLEL